MDDSRRQGALRQLGERISQLEQGRGGDHEVVLLKLDHLGETLEEVKTGVARINGRVEKQGNDLAIHNTRLTVLETFCQEQIKPALVHITDNRIQIATMLAKFGAMGAGGAGTVALLGHFVFSWW
jgi:hypothetical protein